MPLFDAYIFIDWSAKKDPGPQRPAEDNLWVGEYYSHGKYCENYFRTRSNCIKYVLDSLINNNNEKLRTLIGFDFPYAYPRGFAKALGFDNSQKFWWMTWKELSQRIIDESNNSNNRFQVAYDLNTKIGGTPPGPFWGRPNHLNELQYLNTYAPDFPYQPRNGTPIGKFRITESKLGIIHESWGLFGQGRAGSQALVGIPRLHYLRTHDDLSRYSKVWPFETGFTNIPSPSRGPFILHAEIWPGIVSKQANLLVQEANFIKDQAQVRAMCQWAAKLDNNSELGRFFGPPTGLTERQIQDCIKEEGWILGAI